MTPNPTLSEREALEAAKLSEIISDDEVTRVHGHANFGMMSPREVVNDGVRKTAVGYHCGHTQFTILREHGLITKPRPGSYDADLTKKGKAYARALYTARRAPVAPAEPVAWRTIDSAPQDGTKVDLWVAFPGKAVRWPDASWAKAGTTSFSGPDNWASRDGVPLHALTEKPVATHWMPAPAGPGDVATPAQPSTVTAVLKGVGRITGDGWKDTTVKGEVVFVWGDEKSPPYKAGQFDRIGHDAWSASTDQYDFSPATAEDVPAIRALLAPSPVTGALVEALKPFAALAAVRYPEEGGAPSWIDLMTQNGEHNEIELRSHVAAWSGSLTLDGDDFRAAARALAAALAAQKAEI